MFTKKTVRIIDKLVTAGSWLCVLPFIWNRQNTSLCVAGRKQRLVFRGIIAYIYWEALYQGYRLFWDSRITPMDIPECMKLVELFAARLTALMRVTVTWLHSEDMIFFANQLLRLNSRFSRLYGRQRVKDPCAKMYSMWFWTVFIDPIFTTMVYVTDNTGRRYWHGFLLPPQIQPYLVPIFCVVEYWISVLCELGTAFWSAFVVAYFKSNPAWTKPLTNVVKTDSQSRSEEAKNLYRGLLIWNRGFNNACGLTVSFCTLALLADLVWSQQP